MTVVFYDTEYTAWEDSLATGWSLPGHHREIVQIAALRYDTAQGRIVEEFSVLIRPQATPELSDYFIKLTGITQADVEKDGLTFEDAMDAFYEFLGSDDAISYGDDHLVINENFELHAYEERFDGLNIRPWFLTHGRTQGITEKTNSGKIAATMGLKIDSIQEHNALHDVRSIAAGYKHLVDQGATPFKAQ